MLNGNLDVNGLLGAMGVNASKQMDLPVEGTGGGGGFVAPVWGGLHYAFSAEFDMAEHNASLPKEEAISPKFSIPFGKSGWTKMYWEGTPEGFAAAEKARKELNALGIRGTDYRPGLCWYAMCEVDRVVNLTEAKKANFTRPEISAECRVMTLASKKYRHEWHLIVLPMAVSAIARLYRKELGVDDSVDLGFDVGELRRIGNTGSEETDALAVVTDEQYEHLCGNPDERNGHLSSVLWERRAKLWAALGEDDPTKYMPTGTGKDATDAPALNLCLSFMTSEWSAPVWARFAWIPDPRVDAVREGDEKTYRDSLPGLLRLYKTEQAAIEDAQIANGTDTAAAQTASGEPAVPADWGPDMRDEWVEELQKYDDKPAIVAAKKTSSTVEEVEAWRAYLA